ncbi:MAG TPA: RDD family protein [Myxococcales bacterium]
MMETEPPGYPPADARRRAVARAVDLLIALAPLLVVHSRASEILSAALLLFGDSLFGPGRSLGKRLAGLRVVMPAARRPAGIRESLKRNAIFVAGLVPSALGFPVLTSGAALLVIAALEAGVALRPLTRDLGRRRLGDLLAGTQVIDASIALGLPAPVVRETPRAPAPLASRAARKEEPACASR